MSNSVVEQGDTHASPDMRYAGAHDGTRGNDGTPAVASTARTGRHSAGSGCRSYSTHLQSSQLGVTLRRVKTPRRYIYMNGIFLAALLFSASTVATVAQDYGLVSKRCYE